MDDTITVSTRNLKDVAKALHQICQDIERKADKETSKHLPKCIKDFNENLPILQTATRDLEAFQKNVVDKISWEPTEVKTPFKRRWSFKVKRKPKEDISSRDQKTGTNIEDNNQDEERTLQRSYSDYRPDKKKRRQLEIEEELINLRKHNSELETKLNYKEKELRNLRTQFEGELNEIQKRNLEIEAMSRNIGQSLDRTRWEAKDLRNQLSNCRRELTTERTEKDKIKAELEDTLTRQSLDRTRWEAKDLRNQLSNCRRELTTERTEKDKIKAELEDTLTRLSAVASSKLRDNNPNVVDLSDQNRPSKIAEQLSELYDNEWTVAYEVLEGDMSEKECIATLLKMLMDAYNECSQLATEGFYERVQQSIESPFPTKNKSVGTEVKMSDYLKQQIKELRKYRAKFAIEGITEAVAPKIQGDKVKDTDIQAYICKCINICWYMVVQDPPLVFSCGSSGEFDTNVFRSYTRRGPYVDYVVWPALLVSDGSMLSKGIAQGCTSNVDPVSSTVV